MWRLAIVPGVLAVVAVVVLVLRPAATALEVLLTAVQVVVVVVLFFWWNKAVPVVARSAMRLGRRIGYALAIQSSVNDELDSFDRQVPYIPATDAEIRRILDRHERQSRVIFVLHLFGLPAFLLNQAFSVGLAVFVAALFLGWPVGDVAAAATAIALGGAATLYFLMGIGVGAKDWEVAPEQRPVV